MLDPIKEPFDVVDSKINRALIGENSEPLTNACFVQPILTTVRPTA